MKSPPKRMNGGRKRSLADVPSYPGALVYESRAGCGKTTTVGGHAREVEDWWVAPPLVLACNRQVSMW